MGLSKSLLIVFSFFISRAGCGEWMRAVAGCGGVWTQPVHSLPRRRLIALTCATMAQHGIVLILAGALLPAMMDTYGIREAQAGVLLGAGALGFMVGPFLAGLLADRAGTRTVLLVGLGSELILLAAMGLAPTYQAAIVAFFLLNVGAGFIETPVNIIPTLVGNGKSGSLMNLVHMFFSVGAFICPFLAGILLTATGSWRPVWLLAIVPTAVLFAAFVFTPFSTTRRAGKTGEPRPKMLEVLRERAILFGAIAIMLYVAAEFGATNWITLYLQKSLAFTTLTSTSGLSVLWLGLLIGRFANSRLALVRASGELVLWSGIGGLIVGLLLLTAQTPVTAYLWLLALGLCMSGIYPNIMAELNGRNPARMGLITGFLAQAAGLGTLLAQPMLGIVAQQVSLPAAISLIAVLMGLVSLTTYLGAGSMAALREQSPAVEEAA
jgi:fucose permease